MFDRERWGEIWQTLSRNKLRSFLTAFGVGWGIFMLILMLGAGNGLSNGVAGAFEGWASNACYVWAQTTSLPYKGLPRGRSFDFDNDDIALIGQRVKGIEALAPRLQLGGWRGGNNVVRGNKTAALTVNGDLPSIMRIQGTYVEEGRFLHERDVLEKRKVCVVGRRAVQLLYEPDEKVLGSWIRINGVYFQVVGVHMPKASAALGNDQTSMIYVPFSTFQTAFNALNQVHWFAITAQPGTPASQVQADVKKLLAVKHRVHPDDDLAFGSFNVEEMFDMTNDLLTAITALAWFVGICTLIAGVVGVSNIMLVVIRERTNEIGVRRSIGATPGRITAQIVLEALTLTLIAGYSGLLLGMLLLEAVSSSGLEGAFFAKPEIDLVTALVALAVLVVSGVLAGLFPARRALAIRVVDALRADK